MSDGTNKQPNRCLHPPTHTQLTVDKSKKTHSHQKGLCQADYGAQVDGESLGKPASHGGV